MFRHTFVDILNPLRACTLEIECTEHFFLRYHNYISFQTTLMNELHDIDGSSLASHKSNNILRAILYRDKRFNPCLNKTILTATIKYVKNTERLDQSLF